MSSGYYQENRRLQRNMYEPITKETSYSCGGSCTCNLGYRTAYDVNQMQGMVTGQEPQYPVSIVPGWPIG